jgi:S-methylmethionine-dependent homocysteine/selenocysteine methylase
MAWYRRALPQLNGQLFLTDGGMETTLIFHQGIELPEFASFHLLRTAEGVAALRAYFHSYTALARRYRAGFILESATWRANPDWAAKLGYSREELTRVNRTAIAMLEEIREEMEHPYPVVISGCLGPRGDGYVASNRMSEQEAEEYHDDQVAAIAATSADMASAMTLNYAEEGIGIARAAKRYDMPVAISFTVETDGRLPTGQPLGEAIEQVDAATGGYPSYYMLNCAHPEHFAGTLREGEKWTGRLRGLRANASRRSHAELNEAPDLDAGDPRELAAQYAELRRTLPHLNVLGGCCGTDHRHVESIAEACSLHK